VQVNNGITAQSYPSTLIEIEKSVESYFLQLLDDLPPRGDMSEAYSLSVSLEEVSQQDSSLTLASQVTVTYRSNKGKPIFLDMLLDSLHASTNLALANNNLDFTDLVFGAINDDTRMLYIDGRSASKRSSADIGLIVAVSVLSLILTIVSCVLLYITGGWDAMHQCLSNCLFEEIDEDDENYLARSKSTFRVNSSEDSEEDENESVDTHTVHTNPTGILGGVPRTQGLGVVAGYSQDGDDTSRLTMSSANQLGIASFRQMQEDKTPHSLSDMIKQRMNQN